MSDDRLPPHSIDAERSVLSAILVKDDAICQAQEILRDADFYRDQHRRLFKAMEVLSERSTAIDPITVKEELLRTGHLEEVGGPAYIASLLDGVPHASHVEHYARIVKEKAILRGLIDAGASAIDAAYSSNGAGPDEKLYSSVERMRSACESLAPTVKVANLADLLDAPEEPARPCIDSLLEFGSASLASGAPGTWKTTAAVSAALHVAAGCKFADHFETYQAPVLHVDGEMGERRCLALYRRLGRGEGIDVADLARKQFLTYLPATGNGPGRDPRAWARIVRERMVGLVVLDPAVALYGGDENEAVAVRSWWESAVRPLLDLGAAVQVVHHDRKGSVIVQDSPSSATRGSGDWRGAPDLHANIRTEPGDHRLLRYEVTKSRLGPEPAPFYLRVEDHDGGLRLRWAGEAQNVIGKAVACADATEALLERAGDGGMPRQLIIEALLKQGFAKRTIEDSLSLVRDRSNVTCKKVGKTTVYRRLRA